MSKRLWKTKRVWEGFRGQVQFALFRRGGFDNPPQIEAGPAHPGGSKNRNRVVEIEAHRAPGVYLRHFSRYGGARRTLGRYLWRFVKLRTSIAGSGPRSSATNATSTLKSASRSRPTATKWQRRLAR